MLKSFDFQALRSLKDKANDANYLPKKKDAENIEYSSICLNIINLVTWRDIMTQIDFTNFKPNNLYFLPLQYIEKNIKMASLCTFCFHYHSSSSCKVAQTYSVPSISERIGYMSICIYNGAGSK